MSLPAAVNKQPEVQSGVSAVTEQLKPDVLYIRYELGEDWSGDWAMFFRVVLSDEAAAKRLHETAKQVISQIEEQIDFSALGVFPYYNFRSASEQADLQEPAWMPTGPYRPGLI
jgi:hypothetical protein